MIQSSFDHYLEYSCKIVNVRITKRNNNEISLFNFKAQVSAILTLNRLARRLAPPPRLYIDSNPLAFIGVSDPIWLCPIHNGILKRFVWSRNINFNNLLHIIYNGFNWTLLRIFAFWGTWIYAYSPFNYYK